MWGNLHPALMILAHFSQPRCVNSILYDDDMIDGMWVKIAKACDEICLELMNPKTLHAIFCFKIKLKNFVMRPYLLIDDI